MSTLQDKRAEMNDPATWGPVEKLNHSIRMLERVKRNRQPFDISMWFNEPDNYDDCNTAACWAGWCCREPVFQTMGLTAAKHKVEIPCGPDSRRTYVKMMRLPSFGRQTSMEALAAFFGIATERVAYIALYSSYGTRSVSIDDVIAHITTVIAQITDQVAFSRWCAQRRLEHQQMLDYIAI